LNIEKGRRGGHVQTETETGCGGLEGQIFAARWQAAEIAEAVAVEKTMWM
jgi:hypothetical protein